MLRHAIGVSSALATNYIFTTPCFLEVSYRRGPITSVIVAQQVCLGSLQEPDMEDGCHVAGTGSALPGSTFASGVAVYGLCHGHVGASIGSTRYASIHEFVCGRTLRSVS